MKGNACGYVAKTQSQCGSTESDGEKIKGMKDLGRWGRVDSDARWCWPKVRAQRSGTDCPKWQKDCGDAPVHKCGAALLGMK